MADIAVVGLGNMGGPMAKNLVQAGHRVTGFDVVAAARDSAAATGVAIADGVPETVRASETVITMLPAGTHVREVFAGDDGILANAREGALLIDCSTIDVGTARDMHEIAAAAGYAMLDAPVSGGVAGAAAGTLTFMVGGSDAAFQRAKPTLEAMGGRIIHAGGPGNGQVAKVCNNMILGISMIAVSEGFILGERLGLDAKTLFDICSTATASCWAMLNHLPVPGIIETSAANRGYQPGFSAAMMHKDMSLSQAAAGQAGASTPLGAAATALYAELIDKGHGNLDYSAVIKLIYGDEDFV